jgi:prepilin signal peptidase PulO-like enzyme (type II secretory pathway)
MQLFLLFILGTIFGSFANVLIFRLPNNLSILGRSQCPHCQSQLKFWQLFPILSYVILKGQCYKCKTKISGIYPLVEGLLGGLFVFIGLVIQPTNVWEWLFLFRALLLTVFGVIVFFIDFKHFLIMDNVNVVFGILFLSLNFLEQILFKNGWNLFSLNLLGMLAGSLPLFLIWFFSKGKFMGFGDVKLMLILGLALGFPLIYLNLLVAVFLGAIVGIGLMLGKQANLKTALPFGCFLSVGAVLAILYGTPLINWYLSIIGV